MHALYVTMLPCQVSFNTEKSLVQGTTSHPSVKANDSPVWPLNQLSDLMFAVNSHWIVNYGGVQDNLSPLKQALVVFPKA